MTWEFADPSELTDWELEFIQTCKEGKCEGIALRFAGLVLERIAFYEKLLGFIRDGKLKVVVEEGKAGKDVDDFIFPVCPICGKPPEEHGSPHGEPQGPVQ